MMMMMATGDDDDADDGNDQDKRAAVGESHATEPRSYSIPDDMRNIVGTQVLAYVCWPPSKVDRHCVGGGFRGVPMHGNSSMEQEPGNNRPTSQPSEPLAACKRKVEHTLRLELTSGSAKRCSFWTDWFVGRMPTAATTRGVFKAQSTAPEESNRWRMGLGVGDHTRGISRRLKTTSHVSNWRQAVSSRSRPS